MVLQRCNVNRLMLLETKTRVSITETERNKYGMWKVNKNLWWQISIGGSMNPYKFMIKTFYSAFKVL